MMTIVPVVDELDQYDTVLNHIIDLSLLIPVYWILYALPHSFTIPTTRISLPFPFFDNTAQATSIVMSAAIYIGVSLIVRYTPLLYRIALPVLMLETAITSYECVHTTLYDIYHNEIYGFWYPRLSLIFLAELLMFVLLHILTKDQLPNLLTINRYTFLCVSIFTILTAYQLYRGFYSHGGMDDHITVLHQLTLYLTYPTLLFGGRK